MKIQLGVLLAVFCATFAFAQVNPLGMSVSGPATGNVGTNIQYTITITNLTPNSFNVSVTNIFPSPQLTFINGNPTPSSPAPGVVVFVIQLGPVQQAQLTLTLRPTVAGRFTNFVVAATAGQVLADSIATTINESGGGGSGGGDLRVSITPPPSSPKIFVNDWVSYSITVTKESSGSMSGVVVTNTTSPGAIFRRFSAGGSVSGNTLRFNLGTLSLQSTQLHVTIQPQTAATNYAIIARVFSPGDTNTSNNSTTNIISVSNPVLGQLTASPSSEQRFNPQTGLVDQLVTVSNITTTSTVASARVIVSNFPFRVFNAVGTNDGRPFVVHGGSLGPTQSVELLMEYLIPDRTPKDNPDFISHDAGTIDLSAPSGGSPTPITNIVMLPPRGVMTNHIMLQFPSTNGAMYQILYSTNETFSPALRAEPPIRAPANWVQWIDYGPPKTLSRPVFSETLITNVSTNATGSVTNVTTNANMRFYRAIQLR